MGRPNSEWLLTTVSAVRELMIRRLEDPALDATAHREVEMALEEIDVMWEELEAQATPSGGIREANEAAGELFKAARADMVGRAPGNLAWQSLVQPLAGGPLRCQFSVRPIPLKRSGVAGLCWPIRPV
jgi:hypothetical protein